ncbi:hypothetical protein HPB48_012239 [Haemaphysalis longicornis]|uniref:Phosphatidylinositol transfer protein N-terminal domain-containing protein n=1 Tax=Haemaphysalis longicornis TaxID=44386 RepID=A0A9J6G8R9_HAELO|nr:hypothetical protein HPB48_012239 [Haemaphysalis longicornis]
MLIKEYRVVLPLTLEEYKVGQAFTMNELESGNIEVILDEPFYLSQGLWNGKFSSGRHTYRIHHQDRICPMYLRSIAPEDALIYNEETWDAYPYRRTVLTNARMGQYFYCRVETMHASDRGTQENIHELPQEMLEARMVEVIDIARDTVVSEGIERLAFYQSLAQKIEDREGEDPATYVSRTTGQGPADGGLDAQCQSSHVRLQVGHGRLQLQLPESVQRGLHAEEDAQHFPAVPSAALLWDRPVAQPHPSRARSVGAPVFSSSGMLIQKRLEWHRYCSDVDRSVVRTICLGSE